MPINEQVIDAVAHILTHFIDAFPDDDEASPATVAAFARRHSACDHCLDRLVQETGGRDLADAIQRVLDSEAWEAFVGRLEAQASEDG
jgi:hypothetical protein